MASRADITHARTGLHRADASDGGRERMRGDHDVGAGQVVIAHHDAGVGAHLQGAADGLLGILGTHGQGHDLAPQLLDEADGGLDRILVELVEDIVLAADEAGVLQAAFGLHVRDVLDADHDFHAHKIAISGRPRR